MQNPTPVLENDTNKLLWDFDIETNHLISRRKPYNNKKKKEFVKLSTLLSQFNTE